MELVKGSQVLVTVDPAFRTRGNANTVWVDYPNIVGVVPVGGRIYIDDGLISLVVQKIGADAPPALTTSVRWAHSLLLGSPISPQTDHTFPWPRVFASLSQESPACNSALTLGLGWTTGGSFLPRMSICASSGQSPEQGRRDEEGVVPDLLGVQAQCPLCCNCARSSPLTAAGSLHVLRPRGTGDPSGERWRPGQP